MPEYARVCQSMPEYARVCQSMPEYARVCKSMSESCQVVPKSSPDGSESESPMLLYNDHFAKSEKVGGAAVSLIGRDGYKSS